MEIVRMPYYYESRRDYNMNLLEYLTAVDNKDSRKDRTSDQSDVIARIRLLTWISVGRLYQLCHRSTETCCLKMSCVVRESRL